MTTSPSTSVLTSADPPPAPWPMEHAIAPSVPHPLTSFIDREDEVAAIEALLAQDDVRLVTLTGPGGVGKTRIALALADRHDRRGDEVRYVPLATVRDAGLVLSFIAQRLLPHGGTHEQVATQLAAFLADKRFLLVLDNVEQVVDAAPGLASLLERCPGLTLLVTSRIRLRITGERGYPISPLPLPDTTREPDLTRLSTIAAVRLFVDRGQAAFPTFALTTANATTVAEICWRLDGLPLALELAAARLRMLPLAELRTRLDQRLPLLTGGARDLPERQQTIRATIAWSHDLLAPDEQRFFRQMAVCVGGFTLGMAEAVTAAAGGDLDVMTGLTTLVDHSLVRRAPGEGEARYLMLETVREFGLEQLATSGEEETVRLAHARALLDLARRIIPDPAGHPSYEALGRLDAEISNIRAALTWLAQTGRTHDLADLALHLHRLWYFAYVPEGLRWYETILRDPAAESYPALAALLLAAGQLATTLEPTGPQGIAFLDRAQALAHTAGEISNEAEATLRLGIAAEDAGDPATAETFFQQARALWARLDSAEDIAVVDYHLGIIAYGRGDLTAATDLLNHASAAATAAGDRMVSAWCAWYLALVACAQGAPATAAAALDEYHREADEALRQSLHWAKHFAAAAVLAATMGEDATAARLFGAVAAERQDDPLGWPECETVDRVATAVRTRLGEQADEAARQAGGHLAAGEVVTEIDRLLDRAAAAPPPPAVSALPVTPREQEILRLIADGKSNRQIAEALFLSPRTVSTHITNILAKLNVDSRTAAAAYAMRRGIA